MPYTPMSALPSKDARTVTEDRIHDETPKPLQASRQYLSTAEGDVQTLVVEPSFDGSEKTDGMKESRESWQGLRATEEGKPVPPSRTLPSADSEGAPSSHARNLSAHFFDAASIKDSMPQSGAPGVSFDDQSHRSGYPIQHSNRLPTSPISGVSPVSPAVGQKHNRTFSGDMSNPAFAHRRVNSIGSAAPVERGAYYGGYHQQGQAPVPPPQDHSTRAPAPSRHHRQDSAGLDTLYAAIHATDVPNEEIAKAAGAPSPLQQSNNGAMPPTEAPREAQRSPHDQPMTRTSPPTMGGGPYEYPPNGSMGAPQYRPPHPGYQQPSYAPPAYYSTQQYYPQGAPPPSHGAPPGHRQRQMSQGYPMQYAPPRGQSAHSEASFAPPRHAVAPPSSQFDPRMHRAGSSGKIETDEQLFANQNMQYRAAPVQWGAPLRAGTSTGVQTFVTTMGVGDGNKTMNVSATQKSAGTNTEPISDPQQPGIPSTVGHHRKLSSFSSLSTIMGSGMFPEDQAAQPVRQKPGSSYFHNPTDQVSRPSGPPPSGHHRKTSSTLSFLNSLDEKAVTGGGHHRSTSSSVSFLGLDSFDPNEAFTSPLDGQPGPFVPSNTMNPSSYNSTKGPYTLALNYSSGTRPPDAPSSAMCVPVMPSNQQGPPAQASAPADDASARESSGRLAVGGTSKRVRRKCTVENCPNRVVQGGLCISHGAKRKQCKHPGCTKNVKKAGLCSTHGPARKRCEAEGCQKVAVQGGRCIAHGAKKKLCEVEGCNKQAILSGMCKKHHDKVSGGKSSRRGSDTSERDPSPSEAAEANPAAEPRQANKPSHTRGLSIFQEVSPENIQNILSEPGSENQGAPDMM